MVFELSETEHEVMVHLVETELHNLEVEIAHTDLRDFRNLLKGRRELLEGILARLACSDVAAV